MNTSAEIGKFRTGTYTPELNSDAQIGNVLKFQKHSNWCPDTIEEMKDTMKGVMSGLKRNPERIRNAMVHSRLPLPSIHLG
ncbi:MAG: hypothetical protein JRN15_09550 [Nitrososphaerota archaeon]|nr:hypothetical protein [Nitrososphaerota archaeon]